MASTPRNDNFGGNERKFLTGPHTGASLLFSLSLSQRELRRLQRQLVRAAEDPRLARLGIPPSALIAMAAYLEACAKGWLSP